MIEIGLLLALCFFLPLLEAPKNLLWLAYAAAWLANRARTRDFGGPWDLWDTLIAVWISSGFLLAAFAGLQGEEWRGAGDLLRYGSLLWMVKRGGYEPRQVRWILGTLVASTVVAITLGYVSIWRGTAEHGYLQLNSVGHVNHSAVYIALTLGICAAWIFSRWRSWRFGTRAVGVAVSALVLVSLVYTASRGAIAAGLALLPLLALAWWPRSRAPLAVGSVVVAIVVGAAILGGAEAVQKYWDNVRAGSVLSFRDALGRTALAAWQQHPWFGVGMGNFGLITAERVRAWDAAAGRAHAPERYFFSSHAHNLYANALAERGAVGFGMLAAVLIAWAVFLARHRPGREDPDQEWLVWGCALAAWIVSTLDGLVNTTLHHENGMLAAVLLGLWLSRLAPRRAS